MCEVSEHCEYTLETCPFCTKPSTIDLIQSDIEVIIKESEGEQIQAGNRIHR